MVIKFTTEATFETVYDNAGISMHILSYIFMKMKRSWQLKGYFRVESEMTLCLHTYILKLSEFSFEPDTNVMKVSIYIYTNMATIMFK